ncbi:MAG: alpha/beta fold hydrolase [Chloroflexi bacterium]|nr:MAG: alpha/beta fold hydrolase [Chloroflexota bacterium]
MILKISLSLIGLAVTAGILLVGLPLAAEAFMTRGTPWTKGTDPASELGLAFEDVAFPTADGFTLRGWFIPAEDPDAPAIVYAHGSGSDQRSGLVLAPWLHHAGYNVLLFSYRDHGQSDHRGVGLTYGYGESQDIDSAVRFLSEVKGIRRIGVIGYSIGGASAILSAARNPLIDAVVAVAPFSCTPQLWAGNRPQGVPSVVLDVTLRLASLWKGFPTSDTCPLDVVSKIGPRPLLLIHGTADQYIPPSQSEQLYNAASMPKTLWLLEGATHETVRTRAFTARGQAILDFLRSTLATTSPTHAPTRRRHSPS